jgi:hypothetical protein
MYFPKRWVWNIWTLIWQQRTCFPYDKRYVKSTVSSKRILCMSRIWGFNVSEGLYFKGDCLLGNNAVYFGTFCTCFGETCCLHHQCRNFREHIARDAYLTSGNYRRITPESLRTKRIHFQAQLHRLNTFLIIPTKCTMFIHYIHLLYLSSTFRCYIHNHQGELLCPWLKTVRCY